MPVCLGVCVCVVTGTAGCMHNVVLTLLKLILIHVKLSAKLVCIILS